MKTLIRAAAIAVVLAAPIASFAQTAAPATRAQVKAELLRFEQAGYNPSHPQTADYPANVLAAKARMTQQSGMGNAAVGSTQSGAGVSTTDRAATDTHS